MNRTRDLRVCSAVPQPLRHRVPTVWYYQDQISELSYLERTTFAKWQFVVTANKEHQTNKIQCRTKWHFFTSQSVEALNLFNIRATPAVQGTRSVVYTEYVPTICFHTTVYNRKNDRDNISDSTFRRFFIRFVLSLSLSRSEHRDARRASELFLSLTLSLLMTYMYKVTQKTGTFEKLNRNWINPNM
jgi:hypothetical protein